ncbi:hypothetical protein [Kribbella solani]|uniref:Nucleotidyl transferase AbiEii/AbiGii toxin family protein n=1 Tax=Kribbella solani TaxID=236067 RepID=A0A841E313_9ACTN|nr:hypothetical protein [Kribbella solani]MBB5983436.1 hypothetical protein [Kribbella solani]
MKQPLNRLEANRLRRSLGTKLANEAKSRGVAADPVRKQYIFAIFLSRVFQDRDVPWVLLGGNALLIRIGGGRFTQDVDLARETPWASSAAALSELRQLSARPYRDDPFEFELYSLASDLADIVRIIAAIPFDAGRLVTVLRREAGRRRMELPTAFRAPSSEWRLGFPRAAAEFAQYPRQYWDLSAALSFCDDCLGGLLKGDRTTGSWDPEGSSWR